MKILIVDDKNTIRRVTAKMLEAVIPDCELLEAADGATAIEIFEENQDLKLCLLDIHMPKMNGIECLQKLRKMNKKTPIVMLTTDTNKPMILQAIKMGANDYLVKPFTEEHVKDRLVTLLNKNEDKSDA